MVLELTAFLCGILILYNNEQRNDTLFSDLCSPHVSMTESQMQSLNKLMSIIHSSEIEGKLKFKYIASTMALIQCAQLVLILTKANKLGESVMMLLDLFTVVRRFFITIGILFLMFMVVGRILFS